MKLKNIFLTAFSVLALASCVTEEKLPVQVTPKISFDTNNAGDAQVEIARKGETKTVAINATGDWTLSCSDNWVKISPMSGTSATKDFTVTVETENASDDNRTAKVIAFDENQVASDTLYVIQVGAAGEFNGTIKSAEAFLQFLAQANTLVETDEVELLTDVNLGGAAINPVTEFSAKFEGNGHSIYNFTISSDKASAGLFLTNKGTIKNLVVGSADGKAWDGTTKITFVDGIEEGPAAGLIAENHGVVENVKNFASVDFNAGAPADAAVGGVVGKVAVASAVIKGCENYGAVTLTGVQAGRAAVGGVLGFSNQAGAVIENCINEGTVIKATVNAKELALGGVIGRANSQLIIKNCENKGIVSYDCTEKPGSYVHTGGIIGAAYSNCQLTDCKNKGEISSNINQVNRIGGIVGTMNTGGALTNCVNDGTVTVNQPENANWQSAAGICGFEEKGSATMPLTITKCTNNGAVSLILNNTTTHANKASVGGLIGLSCSVVEYSENVNNGAISAKNTGATPVYVGGIVGSYIKGAGINIHNNLNTGAVSFEASEGAAGGIIGFTGVAGCVIKEETNRGAVTGSTASTIGAIAGNTAAPLDACAVAGTVGGVEVTSANLAALIQGSASTGTPKGCFVEGGVAADFVAVNPTELEFLSGVEEKTVAVSSNCDWTAVSSQAWLTLSVAEGNGEVTVTLTSAENPDKQDRTAEVTFASKKDAAVTAVVKVTQKAKPEAIPGNQIKTVEHLKAFLSMAAEAEATTTYTIENDIDFSAETLEPAVSFAGTLDGKGHKITLKAEQDVAHLALIHTLTGTVKNITIAGSLKSTYTGESEHYVAGLVTVVNNGNVEGCINEAAITAVGTSQKNCYVAGLVASAKGTAVSIKNCKNTGKLTVQNTIQSLTGGILACGLVNSTDDTITITDCENSGEILMDHKVGNSWDYTGGLIGKLGNSKTKYKMFTIKNCTFSGKLTIAQAPKTRGGAVFGSCGVSTDYEISSCVNTGTVEITSTEAVDRLIGGIGPGFSEANAVGTISNCTFSGTIKAVDGGNLYLGGIYGNNGSGSVVIDNCKTTAACSIGGYTTAKSVGLIAARPNKAGFTVKNCKVAGKITTAAGEEITVSADNLADWMFKGSATSVEVTLENNVFNAE